ncbi:NUDIX hydrolase [bacterium]|nr:NUDIX hydrolase [bacterium]
MNKTLRERVSIVVVHQGKILGFHAEDPQNKKMYFFIPGGRIEDGESALEAAQRETFEETGYRIEVLEESVIRRRYDFEWDGRVFDCITLFFAGRLISEDAEQVRDADYHRGAAWVSLAEVDEIFAYHKDILEPVKALLKLAEK